MAETPFPLSLGRYLLHTHRTQIVTGTGLSRGLVIPSSVGLVPDWFPLPSPLFWCKDDDDSSRWSRTSFVWVMGVSYCSRGHLSTGSSFRRPRGYRPTLGPSEGVYGTLEPLHQRRETRSRSSRHLIPLFLNEDESRLSKFTQRMDYGSRRTTTPS